MTVFPTPDVGDDANRVFVSVGHQQMMTDAMKPLGISMWLLTTPAAAYEAGGRLFVDVTQPLSRASNRANLLQALGKSDPLIRDALESILARGDFIPVLPGDDAGGPIPDDTPEPVAIDPGILTELIEENRASVAALELDIATKSGVGLVDFILGDIQELRRLLFDPRSLRVIMAAMDASWWLDDQLSDWLGEKSMADTLTRSAPDNVTSEMGLALLWVADAIRPHPAVVAFLETIGDDGDLADLVHVPGGNEALDAIGRFLDSYGMRCVGEIDITRPRWSENPAALVPALLADIRNFEPGAGDRRFEEGRLAAAECREDILKRLRALPDGARKAEETAQAIDRLRRFIGYREYPKYGMVQRYFIYKRALLAEAARLVEGGVLRERDDIFYLSVGELRDVVATGRLDRGLITARRQAFEVHQTLRPPRVLTSDGEAVAGAYRRDDLAEGALAGLGVSAGTVEGRARVIADLADADLEPGDILVTTHTDPSWSPLFPAISGLVTEVGGTMTHGAVVAREYGLPAVVGVEGATRLIKDQQRIRIDGSDGYVEFLPTT